MKRKRSLKIRLGRIKINLNRLKTGLPSLEIQMGRPDDWKPFTPETGLYKLAKLEIRMNRLERLVTSHFGKKSVLTRYARNHSLLTGQTGLAGNHFLLAGLLPAWDSCLI